MLTQKQKKFADKYLETGNGTMAAKEAYTKSNDNCAAVEASRTLRKDKIQEYLANKADRASQVIFELLESAQNETVRLNAGKDILDRAGFKPVDKKDLTSNGESLNKVLVQFIDGNSTNNSDTD
jgi:phage terminase small subunit